MLKCSHGLACCRNAGAPGPVFSSSARGRPAGNDPPPKEALTRKLLPGGVVRFGGVAGPTRSVRCGSSISGVPASGDLGFCPHGDRDEHNAGKHEGGHEVQSHGRSQGCGKGHCGHPGHDMPPFEIAHRTSVTPG